MIWNILRLKLFAGSPVLRLLSRIEQLPSIRFPAEGHGLNAREAMKV